MIEMEKGGTNVYEDIERPDAGQMLVKAQLAAKIGEIIRQRGFTQQQAAQLVNMPQPKLSGLLRGHFRGISEVKMLECLNFLGSDIEIIISKPGPDYSKGDTRVTFA
ncbi:MAG: helix-turn-helix domain-containing protein [Thermodesulfobacteriota bacterium]